MSKITKINLEQIFDGSGQMALSLEILTVNGNFCRASLPVVSDNKVLNIKTRLIWQEKLTNFFVDQEVDDGLWQQAQNWIKKQVDLPLPIPLLIEIAIIKITASVGGQDIFEQINFVLENNEITYFIPTPLITLFNGGAYGDTNLDFEDYLLIPLSKSKTTFEQKIISAGLVYRKLAQVLKTAGYDTDTGMMGGYAPNLVSTVEAFDLIMASINLAGFSPAIDFGLGLDIGSANLYNPADHNYLFRLSHNYFNTQNLSHLYREWLNKYPIFYLEDCLAADDMIGWQELSQDLRTELVLAGDKLFANDEAVLRRGLKAGLANSVVVQLQAYTSLTEVFRVISLAKKHNYQVIMSAGGQETNDAFIADLAVALGADFVKFGAMSRGERMAKYNRLLSLSRRLENFF